ncbi:MAG: hypothetical protein M0Q88_02710 [Bacilli bacterium]|nr:hypothetical protein [Bacilli bacterium]
MGHLVPKELRGEERLFVIPKIGVPVYKKSLTYNGPATLLAIILGKITGSETIFFGLFIILNILVYPLGVGRISRKTFDNGFMNKDMYYKQLLIWKLKGGGNIYISHKFNKE